MQDWHRLACGQDLLCEGRWLILCRHAIMRPARASALARNAPGMRIWERYKDRKLYMIGTGLQTGKTGAFARAGNLRKMFTSTIYYTKSANNDICLDPCRRGQARRILSMEP